MSLIWHDVLASGELPENRPIAARAGMIELALIRSGGALYAIEDRCPHMRFPLSKGFACEGKLICGWHHWEFDLAEGQRYLNPEARCALFPVKEKDGRLLVGIDLDDLPPAPGGFARPSIDEPPR